MASKPLCLTNTQSSINCIQLKVDPSKYHWWMGNKCKQNFLNTQTRARMLPTLHSPPSPQAGYHMCLRAHTLILTRVSGSSVSEKANCFLVHRKQSQQTLAALTHSHHFSVMTTTTFLELIASWRLAPITGFPSSYRRYGGKERPSSPCRPHHFQGCTSADGGLFTHCD